MRSTPGVLSVLLLLAATSCGHVPERKTHRNDHSVALVQTSAHYSVTLPDGYDPITTLAGDPNGSGVWFWADTQTTLAIFQVDGQGKLNSWPVLTGADNAFQALSGLTVTSAGMVWLGINATLTRLNPSTGAVQTWRIPAPADNPAAEAFRPANTQGQYLVQAIAASPGGSQIAIAMDLSSTVELFDPSAGTFTQIAMPAASDTPVSLAYAPDGTLGVGLANYQTHNWDTAVVVKPGTTTGVPAAIPVPDSRSITGYGTSGFIVGATDPSLLTTTGTVTPIAAPAAAAGTYTPDSGHAIIAMPHGQLGTIGKGGVFEYPGNATSVASATAGSLTLQLPGVQCPVPQTIGSPEPSPSSPCYPEPSVMAVDGAGGVWVVPNTTNESVEQIVS